MRSVWAYVEQADLTALYDAIRAVEGAPGRPPIDPKILLALWLYATLDGVGSARELDRLTREHQVYQWICGDVPVNHHTLADFRSGSSRAPRTPAGGRCGGLDQPEARLDEACGAGRSQGPRERGG